MAPESVGLLRVVSIFYLVSFASAIGVNYGQIASNLPPPAEVLALIKTTSINKVKLYGADPTVLNGFADTEIELIIGAGNDQIAPLANDPSYALEWVNTNIVAYPNTKIVAVSLGNEVLTFAPDLDALLLPALKNLQAGLVSVGLADKVKVSTPHSLGILDVSFPPSAGTLQSTYAETITPILGFLQETGSPFMINVYPYFAYASAPNNISLSYVLFDPAAEPVLDNSTGLMYSNMFDAQIDAVYAAISKAGYDNISIAVTETGWPSLGDPDEVGATMANAETYNSNLIKHIDSGIGTPAKPNSTLDTYIFALYNEDLKPGPTSEKNFGLFFISGTAVYSSGLNVAPATFPPPDGGYGNPSPLIYSPPPAIPSPVITPYSPPPPPATIDYSPPPFAIPPPPFSIPPPPPPTPYAYTPPPIDGVPALPPTVSYSPPPPPIAAGYPALPPTAIAYPPTPPPAVGYPTPPPTTIGYYPPPSPTIEYSPPPTGGVHAPPPAPTGGVYAPPPAPLPTPSSPPVTPAPVYPPGTPNPLPPTPTTPVGASWCVAKEGMDPAALQTGLDYACGNGVDCAPIQAGGACFEPDTVISHASFAFNGYYQVNNRNYWNCYFGGAAAIVTVDPSYVGCAFTSGS